MLTRRTWQAIGLFLWVGVATSTRAQTAPAEPVAPAPAAPDPNAPLAAPSDQEQSSALDEEARQRFELGRTFYEAGRFRQAVEEFAEAYRLSGRPQLLYNLYVANRDAGNWQEATNSLQGYLDKVPDAPDRITLRARLESMQQQNELRKKEQAEAEAARKRAAVSPTRTEKVHSKIPWILTGAGGVLLIGSIVTGAIAKNKNNDLDEQCADGGRVCPDWRRDEANKAYALAVSTDVMWTVGAASAITGLVLWYTGVLDKERQVPIASVGITPHGMSGSFTVRY